jgi:hypothetical membrane protein
MRQPSAFYYTLNVHYPAAWKVTFRKIGILCGILAPILWASAIFVTGSLRPEYSHLTQYISELGERGGSTEFIMRYAAFVPTGLMHMAFAAFLYVKFKGSPLATFAAMLLAINGVSRIAAGMFPCEIGCALPRLLFSQKLHSLSVGAGFFALISASVLWGILFRRYQSIRCLSAYSIGSGCLGLVFLVLMLWSAELRASTGLYERLSSGILSMWVLVFAVRLWRLKAYNMT